MALTFLLILVTSNQILLTVLAVYLRKRFPSLSRKVDAPSVMEWSSGFWVFHFLQLRNSRNLPATFRTLTIFSTLLQAISVLLLGFLVLRFVSSGGSL